MGHVALGNLEELPRWSWRSRLTQIWKHVKSTMNRYQRTWAFWFEKRVSEAWYSNAAGGSETMARHAELVRIITWVTRLKATHGSER